MSSDIIGDTFNKHLVGVQVLGGVTAETRTIPGSLSILRRIEQLDVFWAGASGSTGWSAVDAGGFDAVDEYAVVECVALQYRFDSFAVAAHTVVKHLDAIYRLTPIVAVKQAHGV